MSRSPKQGPRSFFDSCGISIKSALWFTAGLIGGMQLQFFVFFSYYYNPLLKDVSSCQHELEVVNTHTIQTTNANIQLSRDVSNCQHDLDTCNNMAAAGGRGYYGGNGFGFDSELEKIPPATYLSHSNAGQSFSMNVYAYSDIVSGEIQRGGSWEQDKIEAFNDIFLKYSEEHSVPLKDLTFIDIGANVGWFTMNMAALGVNVLAFEPMEENIAMMEKTLKMEDNVKNGISDRVKLFKYGLGTKDQTCLIYSDDGNVGDGHVKCVEGFDAAKIAENKTNIDAVNGLEKIIPQGYSVRGSILMRRLDDVMEVYKKENENLKVIAVKMDTEGYEGGVLDGGAHFLLESDIDVIISEFNPKGFKDYDPAKFVEKISNAGYRVVNFRNTTTDKYLSPEDMVDVNTYPEEGKDLIIHSPAVVKNAIESS